MYIKVSNFAHFRMRTHGRIIRAVWECLIPCRSFSGQYGQSTLPRVKLALVSHYHRVRQIKSQTVAWSVSQFHSALPLSPSSFLIGERAIHLIYFLRSDLLNFFFLLYFHKIQRPTKSIVSLRSLIQLASNSSLAYDIGTNSHPISCGQIPNSHPASSILSPSPQSIHTGATLRPFLSKSHLANPTSHHLD